MTVAYWCILVALLVPYFLPLAAHSQVPRGAYVDDPRAYTDTLTRWRWPSSPAARCMRPST